MNSKNYFKNKEIEILYNNIFKKTRNNYNKKIKEIFDKKMYTNDLYIKFLYDSDKLN